MNDHQIIRELLKHVIFRMMGAVTVVAVIAIALIISYAIQDNSWKMLLWILGPLLWWFIVFHFQWRNPARVHKLIELLSKEVQDHIGKNFEIVCLEGNMKDYIKGVFSSESDIKINKQYSFCLDEKFYFKYHEHYLQSHIIGYYLRSKTKWA